MVYSELTLNQAKAELNKLKQGKAIAERNGNIWDSDDIIKILEKIIEDKLESDYVPFSGTIKKLEKITEEEGK